MQCTQHLAAALRPRLGCAVAGRGRVMLARSIGVVLLLAPVPALAENWRVVSTDSSSVQYVDADTIQRGAERIEFTREIRWDAPNNAAGMLFDRVVLRSEVSCGDRLVYTLQTVALLGEQAVGTTGPFDEPDYAEDGTNLDGAYDAVCTGQWASGTIADRAAHNARTMSERRAQGK